MKILVILTGGTIACRVENNIMDTNSDTAYDILRLFNNTVVGKQNKIDFTVKQPFTILSENYTANTYNTLIDYLYSCNINEYDGVIITHGSDTLSYTSAMIGMLMRDTEIPIILTASDYPLSDEKSNGLSNFSACVELIKSKLCSGVFTAYGEKGHTYIYLSTRICEADPVTDSFTGCGNAVVAQVIDNKLCKTNEALLSMLKNKNNRLFKEKPVIENDILLLKTYPNQYYNRYNIDGLKAVVIYMYHSATACTVGENTNLCSFIEHCNKSNVDVYIASLKAKAEEYATAYEIESLKTNKLYNISKESAYIKALLAYNQQEYSAIEVMNTNIYFECQ
ncbi:MAG: asparaginase domain-containing protein [Acutalibacteraceae bacterium]|nr:asparaginase domain-containing protein [Acutalibacteraceae bacterium]